jgi:hypothetical protein
MKKYIYKSSEDNKYILYFNENKTITPNPISKKIDMISFRYN